MPQKAVFKKPEDMCGCLRWMADNGIISFGQAFTDDAKEFLMPVIECGRSAKSPYASVKYCPNCGQPTFNVIDDTSISQENHV